MPATGDRITKRKDGLFQGMYTAQTPDGPKRKYVYGRKKKDVEQKLAEAMGDAARGIVFDAGTLTVGQWLDSWLSDGLKPLVDAGKMTYSTYKRYAGIVGRHLKPALGHRKLKDVTRVEVRKLYAAKSETLSPRSVDYIHITLQKALSQAVRDDLIPRNVAAGERPHSTRHASPDRVTALSPPKYAPCSTQHGASETRRCTSSPCTRACGKASCWGSSGRTSTAASCPCVGR
jgi:hypothetical protein